CGLAVVELRVAVAEGQRGGDVELELLRAEVDREPALGDEEVGVQARRAQLELADDLEAEGVRAQRVGAVEVRAARAEARQRQRLDPRLAREVDLQGALREQVDAVLLERGEVRLDRGDAPE